jgi:S-formylglutathione hydrolase FrmB
MSQYPNLSHLAIRRVSAALMKHVELIALVPEEGDGPFPAVLLLHGMMDDLTTWLRRTSLERYLLGRGMAVILPDGGRSWWSDWPEPLGRYESLALETVAYACRLLPLRKERAGWAVAGVSMGGYGALKLGWKHPDRFAAIAALAPAVEPCPNQKEGPDASAVGIGGDSLFALSTRVASTSEPPALTLACGREDRLFSESLRLHEHLGGLGYRHTWRPFNGDHFWDAWDRELPMLLDDLQQAIAPDVPTAG